MSPTPVVGIGHLTMLDVAPPEWVSLAAAAGFDAVGLRVVAAGPTEVPWPMTVGSPMLVETVRRLAETGVTVLDVEIVKLAPDSVPASYEPLFEIGAQLHASFVNVMADDPDLERIRQNFADLAVLAGPYGLRPVIEPMAYMRVRSLADAIYVARDTGGGVTVDPLHLRRFGATPDDLPEIDTALLLYYQLCDAPLAGPSGLPRPAACPGGSRPTSATPSWRPGRRGCCRARGNFRWRRSSPRCRPTSRSASRHRTWNCVRNWVRWSSRAAPGRAYAGCCRYGAGRSRCHSRFSRRPRPTCTTPGCRWRSRWAGTSSSPASAWACPRWCCSPSGAACAPATSDSDLGCWPAAGPRRWACCSRSARSPARSCRSRWACSGPA